MTDLDPGLLRGSGRYRRGRCPQCEAREQSLSVDLATGWAKCHRASCDWRGRVHDGLVRSLDEVRDLERRDRSDRAAKLARVLQACRPIDPRGPVGAYLVFRIAPPPWPADLREADLYYGPERRSMPCMVALVRDVDGRVIGTMRTWCPGGRALRREPRRMAIGELSSGAVRLGEASDRVTLCEGIEDGLAAMRMCPTPPWGPAWACLSTSGLQRAQLPPPIRYVTIFADADAHHAGELAADAARSRFEREGRFVQVFIPSDPSAKDAADVLGQTIDKEPGQ